MLLKSPHESNRFELFSLVQNISKYSDAVMSIQYQIIEQKDPHDMVLHGEEVNKVKLTN